MGVTKRRLFGNVVEAHYVLKSLWEKDMLQRFKIAALMLAAFAFCVRADDTKKSPAENNLEKLKKLAGTWAEADKDGKPTDTIVSVYKITSGGSAVHETIFPGQPMEMVSVYHLNGSD